MPVTIRTQEILTLCTFSGKISIWILLKFANRTQEITVFWPILVKHGNSISKIDSNFEQWFWLHSIVNGTYGASRRAPNIEFEFAKKIIIQAQITITFYVSFEFLWNRRYVRNINGQYNKIVCRMGILYLIKSLGLEY